MRALRLFAATVAVASTALRGRRRAVGGQAGARDGQAEQAGLHADRSGRQRQGDLGSREGLVHAVLPAGKVTLHLRARAACTPVRSSSAGSGRKAILGVKGGARLGVVVVKRGYARPKRGASGALREPSVTAKARKGVPVGAAVFGRVKAKAGGLRARS